MAVHFELVKTRVSSLYSKYPAPSILTHLNLFIHYIVDRLRYAVENAARTLSFHGQSTDATDAGIDVVEPELTEPPSTPTNSFEQSELVADMDRLEKLLLEYKQPVYRIWLLDLRSTSRLAGLISYLSSHFIPVLKRKISSARHVKLRMKKFSRIYSQPSTTSISPTDLCHLDRNRSQRGRPSQELGNRLSSHFSFESRSNIPSYRLFTYMLGQLSCERQQNRNSWLNRLNDIENPLPEQSFFPGQPRVSASDLDHFVIPFYTKSISIVGQAETNYDVHYSVRRDINMISNWEKQKSRADRSWYEKYEISRAELGKSAIGNVLLDDWNRRLYFGVRPPVY